MSCNSHTGVYKLLHFIIIISMNLNLKWYLHNTVQPKLLLYNTTEIRLTINIKICLKWQSKQ